MKKIFSLQTNLKNYTYPVIKIIVSLSIIIFSIFRSKIFSISSTPIKISISVVCFALSIASILCIYIAVPELYYVWKNRRTKKPNNKIELAVPFSLSRVVDLAKENDIIEFIIQANNSVIKIGTSSDCKAGSSKFFDKRFYIENEEYLTLEEFEKALIQYAIEDNLSVVTIDGIKAEKW